MPYTFPASLLTSCLYVCNVIAAPALSVLQPCIIGIEDVFESPDALYIVLEL